MIIMQELGAGLIVASLYGALAWALLEIGLRSWARPERLDSSWAWTWPAPARHDREIGPSLPPLRRGMNDPRGYALQRSPQGVMYWRAEELVVDPVHVGATEDWSPKHAATEAEESMLPLDDVDEWLAGRLREYDSALARIDAARVSLVRGEGYAPLDERLRVFGDVARRSHYFRMIEVQTGNYGPREHMQLEAMLASC